MWDASRFSYGDRALANELLQVAAEIRALMPSPVPSVRGHSPRSRASSLASSLARSSSNRQTIDSDTDEVQYEERNASTPVNETLASAGGGDLPANGGGDLPNTAGSLPLVLNADSSIIDNIFSINVDESRPRIDGGGDQARHGMPRPLTPPCSHPTVQVI